MSIHLAKLGMLRLALAGAAFLGLAVSGANAQGRLFNWSRQDACPTNPCPTDLNATTSPSGTPSLAPGAVDAAPTPGPVTSAALGGALASFGPGYLDNPVPFTHFRLRVDCAYDANQPDRAEFLYAQCGSSHSVQIVDKRIDYQDVRAYMEYAPSDWFSVFAELPYRFLNPELNPNASGLADMNTGFKVALLRDQKSILTFQGRVYIPTGDSSLGLGNDHVTMEPGLLYANSLTEKLVFFAQVEDWIPIGGTDFAGNIINYGAGLSYTVLDTGRFRVSPVLEVLGWTCLSGKEFVFPDAVVQDVAGETIVNGKFGVRFGFGAEGMNNLVNNSDFYIGYGRALTGDFWYKDILRIEYRLRF